MALGSYTAVVLQTALANPQAANDIVTNVNAPSATSLIVGPNGATNPSFQVDTSAASAATGVKVKAAAAGSGAAVSVISSGANEALTVDAKGTGAITIGGTSTGLISLGRGARTVIIESSAETSVSTNGALTISAAALLGGFYIHTGTTGTQTTDTAANIDAAIPGVAVGDSFMCAILPTAAESLAGGTGVTIRGNSAMPAGKVTLVCFTRTGVAAWDAFTVVSA